MRPAVRDRRYLNLSALPVGPPQRLTLRAAGPPRRYNSGMARKSDMRGRRIARTPVTIMGDIRVLTPQELAEFIDRVEPVGSLDEARAFVGRDPEPFGDQLP